MKAIRNVKELETVLSAEDNNWQKTIYEETGVILLLHKTGPILFGNCGYIDLDADAEYIGINGSDKTEYCSILSVNDMIEYILEMPSYKSVLKDVSYGNFCKSELFWAIYSRVIFAEQNLALSENSGEIVYGLYSISECHNNIDLNMAVVAYDAINLELSNNADITLNQALVLLVEQLNEIAKDINEPQYANCIDNAVVVPSTYEELLEKLKPNAEFGWLHS